MGMLPAVPAPASEVTAVRSLLERTVADSELADGPRRRRVREIRDDLRSLVGQADSYLSDGALRQEGGAADRRLSLLRAREKADIRESLIGEGKATAAEMDALGYLSHERLDTLEADGTLEATLAEAIVIPVAGEYEIEVR